MSEHIRNIVAWFYAYYLLKSGRLKKVFKKSDNNKIILSVYFHNPSRKLFEKSVLFFLQRNFNFLSTNQLAEIFEKKLEFPVRSVLFTVDDGWKENQTNIIEIAEKYQIPVTIFLTADPIEKGESYWWSIAIKAIKGKLLPYSLSQMKELPNNDRISIIEELKKKIPTVREAFTVEQIKSHKHSKFVTFGAHTITHPILTKCEDQVSQSEISQSAQIIQSWVNYPVTHFAYPNGNYTEREIAYLKVSGYQTAFTTHPKYITKESIEKPFEIPRFDILENVSFAENICRMTGIWFERKNKTN